MTEAEFERRQAPSFADRDAASAPAAEIEPAEAEAAPAARTSSRAARTSSRARPPAKPRRVQRMFAIEEDLDKKLWLYAIHMGKDRSDVVNDLLRPVVASMVLYDSRERRSAAGQGGRTAAAEAPAPPDDDPADQADVA
jgi:hypothetical protein